MSQRKTDRESFLTVHTTYGAYTKLSRQEHSIAKTHANDAYCMGMFQPGHRAPEQLLKEKRRNNRALSKFYDAKYIDSRDGVKKSGSDLACGRTNRSEPRNGEKNLRIFHGKKVSKGRIAVRRQCYPIQPGTQVMYKKHTYAAVGTHNNGRAVVLKAKVYLSGNCGYYIMPELLFEKRGTTLLPAASGGVSASVFIMTSGNQGQRRTETESSTEKSAVPTGCRIFNPWRTGRSGVSL